MVGHAGLVIAAWYIAALLLRRGLQMPLLEGFIHKRGLDPEWRKVTPQI